MPAQSVKEVSRGGGREKVHETGARRGSEVTIYLELRRSVSRILHWVFHARLLRIPGRVSDLPRYARPNCLRPPVWLPGGFSQMAFHRRCLRCPGNEGFVAVGQTRGNATAGLLDPCQALRILMSPPS